MLSTDYWSALDALIDASEISIDRPRGSAHPHYPEVIYPLDYGFLAATRAGDGDGVDLWLGSAGHQRLVAVILTVDLFKRDVEQKLLLGCTTEECIMLEAFHTSYRQTGSLVLRG